jgi:hypothetical protein
MLGAGFEPLILGFWVERSTQGILKGKYHCTVDLLFDWFGLVFLQIKTKIVSCHTADSKPVKQEVNGTVILPPLVFPGVNFMSTSWEEKFHLAKFVQKLVERRNFTR